VLGAGVMGAQIAAHLVNANVEVILFELAAKEGPASGNVFKAVENLKKLEPAPLSSASKAAYIDAGNYDQDLEKLTSDPAGCRAKSYDIVLTRRDPGPDGNLGTADDAGSVKIYDYNAALSGPTFVANEQLNRPSDRSDTYHTMEFTLNKRSVGAWGASTSFTMTKNHRFLVGISTSPNDDYFPIDDTWTWGYKVSGSYRLPYDLALSGVFDVQPGLKGQRTYIFRSADPDRGTPLRQLSTVTLRLEPFGTETGPVRPAANIRLSKFLKLRHGSLQFSLDALNAFNTNAFWDMSFASGPNFGYGTAFTSPRALQFGAAYEF